MLGANFVRARLIEAVSTEALAASLTRLIEKTQPAEARIVRVHQFFWLRMWKQSGNPKPGTDPLRASHAEDVVCSIAPME
jgi:hypothetical protein